MAYNSYTGFCLKSWESGDRDPYILGGDVKCSFCTSKRFVVAALCANLQHKLVHSPTHGGLYMGVLWICLVMSWNTNWSKHRRTLRIWLHYGAWEHLAIAEFGRLRFLVLISSLKHHTCPFSVLFPMYKKTWCSDRRTTKQRFSTANLDRCLYLDK